MSEISEIKCPNCGQWNPWIDEDDDKCASCGEYLEPERYRRSVETKVQGNNRNYLVINDTDANIVKIGKIFVNGLRFVSYFAATAFFLLMTFIIVLIALFV
jgi:hypothetical protein